MGPSGDIAGQLGLVASGGVLGPPVGEEAERPLGPGRPDTAALAGQVAQGQQVAGLRVPGRPVAGTTESHYGAHRQEKQGTQHGRIVELATGGSAHFRRGLSSRSR